MTFSIENILRSNIKMLAPYSCARDEYKGEDATFLDANENPYDTGYNRYPDPLQKAVKKRLSSIKGVSSDCILLGNGSDEIIDIIIRSVCEPAKDNIVSFVPGYAMYDVSAHINDVQVRQISLTNVFQPDWDALKKVADPRTKVIFICSPNNPVGTAVPLEKIEKICATSPNLVVVDEAYVDFSKEKSAVSLLEKYPNLIVLQTLSKAWGMAGLRLGICFASREIISVFNKVKPPYNISIETQRLALEILEKQDLFCQRRDEVIAQREALIPLLEETGLFTHVYPSDANFILVRTPQCRQLYNFLVENEVVVRLRDIPPLITGGIRITVGTPEQNELLLSLLETYKKQA
ncbi:MAG: histidinol-phosphate transaminase [Flavobacteriales bacterium]|nr:histidinol-phosphate transaminase [Flavobacteriales bacterium]